MMRVFLSFADAEAHCRKAAGLERATIIVNDENGLISRTIELNQRGPEQRRHAWWRIKSVRLLRRQAKVSERNSCRVTC